MRATAADRFGCGPLEIEVVSNNERLRDKVVETLELYNVEWPGARAPVLLSINEAGDPVALGEGRYLSCARMNVDAGSNSGLTATFRSGASARGSAASGRWDASVPNPDDLWSLIDLESLVSLVLTEGWRESGWVPLHAGAVVRNGKCALVCAASGGGKTSLTAALIRRGWKTLGDDKLLLRTGADGAPEIRALVHTFNLHPRTRSWFPEVGDLEELPVYSEWTEKRKVRPESIWSGATLDSGIPTHLLRLTRNQSGHPLQITPMPSGEILSTLLHQTVIPSDGKMARGILKTVARTSALLNGLFVDIADDFYSEPDRLSILEQAVI